MESKQECIDDGRMGLFTGYWIVRKGSKFLHRIVSDGLCQWSHSYTSAFRYEDKWIAVRSAVICQRLYPSDEVYVEYHMSEEDNNLPRIRDYLCYTGCANDGHGGDITRDGLPILSYEEWMKA